MNPVLHTLARWLPKAKVALLGVLAIPFLIGCVQEIDEARLGVLQARPRQPIPDGFRTYTLFLNTSADTAAEYRTAVETLATRFKAFGDSIGERDLAIWIYDGEPQAPDTLEAKTWLDVFNAWSNRDFEYADGPFVAIMNRHPSYFQGQPVRQPQPLEAPSIVVIGFRGLDASGVTQLLEYLERRIRTESVRPTEIEIEALHRQFLAWLAPYRGLIVAFLSRGLPRMPRPALFEQLRASPCCSRS